MKTPLTDESLRQLLRRSWIVALRPNPGFRSAVWARIEARRLPASWGGWLKLNFARIAACATISVALAAASGGLLGTRQTSHEREQLMQRYLSSIDPRYDDQRSVP